MIHNLRDFEGFVESTTSPYNAWNDAVLLAASVPEARLLFLLYDTLTLTSSRCHNSRRRARRR